MTHSEAKNIGGAASPGEQQYSYHNLYVTGLIKQSGVLVDNIDDAIIAMIKWIVPREVHEKFDTAAEDSIQ